MSGRYKPYSEYKDSEVEWLGDVPSHWTVSKFGFLKTVLTDFTANGSFADLKKNAVYQDEPSFARLVRLTDLRLNLENENGVWIDESGYNYLSKSALFGGEFLLANVGAYAGLFYQMPYGTGNASLAPNMFMAKFDQDRVSSEYMAFVGQSECISKQLILFATSSSAQPKLNKDDFKSVRFCFPSLEEQKNIANFLDHETAKIDSLIEKQQRLIQLLKEKRQAMISHAVTKGLNPDAEMRDSGIEWLGVVPKLWDIKSLRYLGFCQNGINIGAEHFGSGYPFVSYGDVYRNEALPKNVTGLVQSSKSDRKTYSVITGDVIFTRTSETIDEIGFSSTCLSTVDEASFAGFLIRFRPKSGLLNANFSKYYFRNTLLRAFFIKEMNLVTRASLSQDLLKKLPVPLPTLEEQKKIAQFLDEKSLAFSKLIESAESAIELSKERRIALISAAVTGKIDVREWIAPKVSQTNREVAA